MFRNTFRKRNSACQRKANRSSKRQWRQRGWPGCNSFKGGEYRREKFDREYASSTWRQFSRVVQIAGRKMGISPPPVLSSSIHFLPAILGSRNLWNTLVLAKNRFMQCTIVHVRRASNRICARWQIKLRVFSLSRSIDRSTFTAESSPPTRKFCLNWIEIVEIGIVGIRAASMLFIYLSSGELLFRFRD